MGHAGLALSTSIVALFGAMALIMIMKERLRGIHGTRLSASAAKIAAAALTMGAACFASSRAVHAALGAGKLAQMADLAVSIPLGIAIFYGAAKYLRVEELEAVRAACYTSLRNAPRPEVGDPPARN